MNIIWTILIGLGTSFIGSMAGFMIVIHYDFEGMWQQKYIEKGRKLDNKKQKDVSRN